MFLLILAVCILKKTSDIDLDNNTSYDVPCIRNQKESSQESVRMNRRRRREEETTKEPNFQREVKKFPWPMLLVRIFGILLYCVPLTVAHIQKRDYFSVPFNSH